MEPTQLTDPESVAALVESEIAEVGEVVAVAGPPRETLSSWWSERYRARFGVAAGMSPHNASILDNLESELGGPSDARELLQRLLDRWDDVVEVWKLDGGRPGVGFVRAYRWAFPRITDEVVQPLPDRDRKPATRQRADLGDAPPEEDLVALS